MISLTEYGQMLYRVSRSLTTSAPVIDTRHLKVIEQEDEDEWDNIISTPHVRNALRRLAIEAREQYHAGETEEGGFGTE